MKAFPRGISMNVFGAALVAGAFVFAPSSVVAQEAASTDSAASAAAPKDSTAKPAAAQQVQMSPAIKGQICAALKNAFKQGNKGGGLQVSAQPKAAGDTTTVGKADTAAAAPADQPAQPAADSAAHAEHGAHGAAPAQTDSASKGAPVSSTTITCD